MKIAQPLRASAARRAPGVGWRGLLGDVSSAHGFAGLSPEWDNSRSHQTLNTVGSEKSNLLPIERGSRRRMVNPVPFVQNDLGLPDGSSAQSTATRRS